MKNKKELMKNKKDKKKVELIKSKKELIDLLRKKIIHIIKQVKEESEMKTFAIVVTKIVNTKRTS